MKRLYSVILLVSLIVGTLQPILPMIEFQLQEGSIIELFGFGEDDTGTHCVEIIYTMENCETQRSETDNNLLDVRYYPLALKITTVPDSHVFLSSTRLYSPSVNHVISLSSLPSPPPPRLS